MEGSFPQYGDDTQVTTAENNPDVWCADKGDGFRVPYGKEMNDNYKNLDHPGAPTNTTPEETPTDPSQLPLVRKVSNSVSNEWGDLTLYPDSGWDTADNQFWVAEPESVSTRYTYNPANGILTPAPANEQRYVACISKIR